jgi:hypothetical protein
MESAPAPDPGLSERRTGVRAFEDYVVDEKDESPEAIGSRNSRERIRRARRWGSIHISCTQAMPKPLSERV